MSDKKAKSEMNGPEDEAAGAEALVEAPDNALAELQDRYLRLAAEYDNYRKRAVKERTDGWRKAQVDLLSRLVDGFDDLARFARVDPGKTDPKTIYAGVDLVERKLWKELEAIGVRRLDQVGVPFDPQMHEAVSTVPAADAAQDHTVGAVLQPGYMLGDTLIRPARVQVLTWGGEGA
jgi:molecular chaperone GrpE